MDDEIRLETHIDVDSIVLNRVHGLQPLFSLGRIISVHALDSGGAHVFILVDVDLGVFLVKIFLLLLLLAEPEAHTRDGQGSHTTATTLLKPGALTDLINVQELGIPAFRICRRSYVGRRY